MKSVLILVLSSTYLSYALNPTDPRNKTKRNLSSEAHHYGEPNGVWLYTDNFKPSPAIRTQDNFATLPKPLALVGLQPVKVFEPKVAAQQVVYEYQPNPSSSVQVKQVFQPENNFHPHVQGEYKPPVNNSPNPIIPSETIVSPVQHSHMIQHPPHQPIINPRIHPLYNVQASYSVQHQPPYYNVQQPTYNVPRKYAYVNGRLIYDPSTFQLQQQPIVGGFYHVNQPQVNQPHVNQPRQPAVHYHNNHLPKPNLIPPPVHQNKFSPPAKHLIQTVDTPSQSPLTREKETIKQPEDNKPVREKEEAEDEDNDKETYEEDESSDEHFGRLRFDDEDDHSDFRHEDDEDNDESERYEDEEEDDNNKRGSKYVVSKYKKHPKKKYNPDKERSYYYTGKYDYPDEKPWKKDGKNKQKMHYKSVKYSKNSRDPVEGRYSENVPVFHKKKVFKEKWYVSKSHNDD